MKQEQTAGIVLSLIGLIMLVFPKQIWRIAESWKSEERAGRPSVAYLAVMRIVSIMFFTAGVLLAIGVLK